MITPCALCGSPSVGRGLCRKHYQAAWKAKSLPDALKVDDPAARLWSRYRVAENGCWEWTGTKNGYGYGIILINKKPTRAHRAAYLYHHGSLPEPPVYVCHKCDNPPCINPDHLFLGSCDDNLKDAAAKNRFPLGERHWNTKLGVETTATIRDSSEPNAVLARRYGVNQSTISRIKTGKRRAKS